MIPDAPTTCFFDADCGFCTALADWAQHRARPGSLVMLANSEVAALPQGITSAVTDRTIVVVTPNRTVYTRVAAVAAVCRTLPGGRYAAWFLLLPGLRSLFGVGYDHVSAHRRQISERLGMRACRVPPTREASRVSDSRQHVDR